MSLTLINTGILREGDKLRIHISRFHSCHIVISNGLMMYAVWVQIRKGTIRLLVQHSRGSGVNKHVIEKYLFNVVRE